MSWKNSYTEEELEIIKEASTQAKNRADEIKKRREAGTQMNYGKRDAGGSGVNRTQQANKIPLLGHDKFHGGNQLTPMSPANIDGYRHNPIANQYRRKMVANQFNGAGARIAMGDTGNLNNLGRMNIGNNGSKWDGTGGKARLDSFSKPALSVNGLGIDTRQGLGMDTRQGLGMDSKGKNPYEKNFSGLGMAGLVGTAGLAGLGLGAYGLYNHFNGEGSYDMPEQSDIHTMSNYDDYTNGNHIVPKPPIPEIDRGNYSGADAFNANMANGNYVHPEIKPEQIVSDVRNNWYQNPNVVMGAGAAAGLGAGMMAARRRNA